MNIGQVKEILGEEFGRVIDFLSSVIVKLELAKNSSVLDVGTGRAHMAITLALHGYIVITGEPEGVYWADWRTSAKKVSVEEMITFKPFNAENLPFEDASFDAIFLYATFHHIDNKERALSELLRVMKSEGTLVIIELTEAGVNSVRERYKSHPDAVDPRDYTKELGLKVKVIESRDLNAYIYKRSSNN